MMRGDGSLNVVCRSMTRLQTPRRLMLNECLAACLRGTHLHHGQTRLEKLPTRPTLPLDTHLPLTLSMHAHYTPKPTPPARPASAMHGRSDPPHIRTASSGPQPTATWPCPQRLALRREHARVGPQDKQEEAHG